MLHDGIEVAAEDLRQVANRLDKIAERVKSEREAEMAQIVVSMLSSVANIMGKGPDETASAIFEAIVRDHRTLQQQMIAMLAGVLYRYAEAQWDGRNEAAVRMCAMIAQLLEDESYALDGKVFLPVI